MVRYEGTVGRYNVSVEFIVFDGDVSGSYYYASSGSDNHISLEGGYDGERLILYEKDTDGSNHGVLRLRVRDDRSLSGTYSNFESGKTFDVYLQ